MNEEHAYAAANAAARKAQLKFLAKLYGVKI